MIEGSLGCWGVCGVKGQGKVTDHSEGEKLMRKLSAEECVIFR